MPIRRLLPSDAAAFQALRLAALRECPSAFTSSHEEESGLALDDVAARLAVRNMFGAFEDGELAGMVGAGREDQLKTRHKGYIRAMYVAPAHRSKGLGRQLMERAFACAAAMEGVTQVTLAVTVGNTGALALYRSLGFVAYGHEPRALLVDGVFYDEIQMVRNVIA